MLTRTSSLRSIALAALLAAPEARAEIRAFVDQAASTAAEQVIMVEAGVEHAARRVSIAALIDGVPSRALTASFDATTGTLNANGRALFVVRGPVRSETSPSVRVTVQGERGAPVASMTTALRFRPALDASGSATFASGSASTVTRTRRLTGPSVDLGTPSIPLRITTPAPDAVVGSRSMDVHGRLAGILNRFGTSVRVNGSAADVFPSPIGQGRFLFPNLELTPGTNAIVIEATAPSGQSFRIDTTATLDPLTSNNVVTQGDFAYAARGPLGLGVMNLSTRTFATMAPPAGSDRVDDVAVADGLLFLLDGASGGRLSVLRLVPNGAPALVSGPVNVTVGPFAGVSAGNGRVVVSGGTDLLTVRTYDTLGQLGSQFASTDLGVGQPDVIVSPDGQRAYVSTDFSGSVSGSGFGITTIALSAPPAAPSVVDRIGLPGAGFTSGFRAPANFPIESALLGSELYVAHGGGLARVDANGTPLGTTSFSFSGVSVDGLGDRLFVVGTGRVLAELSVAASGAPTVLSTRSFAGGAFTGVAATPAYVAIASNAGGLRVLRR